jgi:molecular chaperone GrpE
MKGPVTSDAAATGPAVTGGRRPDGPAPTDRPSTDPAPTDPAPTDPAPTDPAVPGEVARPAEEYEVTDDDRGTNVAHTDPTTGPQGDSAVDSGHVPIDVGVEGFVEADAGAVAGAMAGEPPVFGAELAALRSELDERTADLQRLTAEYANYRKRVDRDRALVVEQATGNVLAALLPVLDDLDRAREHGDLVGPFGTVAENLLGALTKFGLTAFGAKGDPFDPNLHEAVAHTLSEQVEEATCVEVMRRGYLLGERLLRPAMVAVADPQ